MGQLHHLQQFGHLGFNRRRIGAFAARQHGQAKGDVIEHRHMAEQRIVLENEAHFTVASVHPADVGTVEADMTAGLMLQTGDNSQQGGFSGARGPSSATICPEGISNEISFSTWVRPNDFLILAISMLMISLLLRAFFLIGQTPLQHTL